MPGSPSMMTLNTDPIAPDAIWTPDIMLFNTAERPMSELEKTFAMVSPEGVVTWSWPGLLKGTCEFKLEDFPEDTQLCHMQYFFSKEKCLRGLFRLSKGIAASFVTGNYPGAS